MKIRDLSKRIAGRESALRLAALAMLVAAASLAGCDPEPRTACAVGERGCPCTPLATCEQGLVCSSHQCLEPHVASVRVSVGGARACEALLESNSSTLADVSFGTNARGSLARRGRRVGLSMISSADVDLTGRGVEVRWLGTTSRHDIQVLSSTCFDRTGAEIPDAHLEVH